MAKYSDLSSHFVFQPIAVETVETQGPRNESARDLLSDVGRKISDEREIQFLCSVFQLSFNVQWCFVARRFLC